MSQSRPGLLMPWIVLTGVTFCLDAINLIGSLVILAIPTFVIGLFYLGVFAYFFLVVWSFRYLTTAKY